jgi:hypothetical protein
MHCGLATDSEFVVADGHYTVLLEQVDPTLDRVTLLVEMPVDRREPPTRGAFGLAVRA